MTRLLFVAAACVALLFFFKMGRRFRGSGAPFYFWWGLSFLLYATALIMEAVTVSRDWHLVWEYQLYIVASAGLVGAMSVGTTYLAWPQSKFSLSYAAYFVVVELALIVLTWAYPPVLHGSWAALNAGKNSIVGPTQIAYLLLSAVGGPVVVLGTLWSWWNTRHYYTLLIAVGALVPSLAGLLASQGIAAAVFLMMNILGLVLIFIGYVYSRPRHQIRSRLGNS